MPPKAGEQHVIRQAQLPVDAPLGRRAYTTSFLKRYRTEIAASASSVLSTFATVSTRQCLIMAATNCWQFPLDSVKTRMQTYKFKSFSSCVRHTYQTERLRGFFRGVTAPLASVTLVRTISFSVYQQSKYLYASWVELNTGTNPLVHVNTPGTYPTLATAACFGAAGATAGSFITLVACKRGAW